MTEADGSVVSFGYDGQHHLTSEGRTGTNAYSKSYVVDGVGNRTSQTVGGTTTTFTLDTDDELTATSGGFSNSYVYNANGEQTSRTLSGTGNTLAYDYDGQLTSITSGGATTSFAYDALGRLISRTAGGTTTQFLSNPADGHVWLESVGGTVTATYTWGAGLIRKDGEVPLLDGLGSERTVTNSSQTVTGSINYDAFGQSVGSTGSSSDPYMFAATSGYRNDGDAGLSLVGARYYDAQVGRFITRDTFLDQQPYAYCDGDPVNAVDPSGHIIAAAIVYGITTALIVPGAVTLISNIEQVHINNDAYHHMVDMVRSWTPKTEAGQEYKDMLLSGGLRNGNIGVNTRPIMGAIGSTAAITIGLATPPISSNLLKIKLGP